MHDMNVDNVLASISIQEPNAIIYTWVTLTTFLDCPSCISVTKECYIPGISVPKPCNQRTLLGQMCKHHKSNKPHQKCWFICFSERRY